MPVGNREYYIKVDQRAKGVFIEIHPPRVLNENRDHKPINYPVFMGVGEQGFRERFEEQMALAKEKRDQLNVQYKEVSEVVEEWEENNV